jgi:hypothetical protein
MAINRKPQFNKIDVLIAAIISFRKNGSVLRYNHENKTPGNKEEIIEIIEKGINVSEYESISLRAEADLIVSTLPQRVMLNKLINATTSDFVVTVAELLEKETVSLRDFGIIAWAPKLFADLGKADVVKTTLYGLSGTSRYIGMIGSKMEINFTCITAKYLQNYNSFFHQGHDENGNLISFFNKNKINDGKIVARIKAHRTDERLQAARVTVLNYVKVI